MTTPSASVRALRQAWAGARQARASQTPLHAVPRMAPVCACTVRSTLPKGLAAARTPSTCGCTTSAPITMGRADTWQPSVGIRATRAAKATLTARATRYAAALTINCRRPTLPTRHPRRHLVHRRNHRPIRHCHRHRRHRLHLHRCPHHLYLHRRPHRRRARHRRPRIHRPPSRLPRQPSHDLHLCQALPFIHRHRRCRRSRSRHQFIATTTQRHHPRTIGLQPPLRRTAGITQNRLRHPLCALQPQTRPFHRPLPRQPQPLLRAASSAVLQMRLAHRCRLRLRQRERLS